MENKNLVVKANVLIEAQYKFGLKEQKLLIYAISKIDDKKESFQEIEFNTKQYSELVNAKQGYSEIRNILRKLKNTEIIIDTNERELITSWILRIDYKKNSGEIRILFDDKLIPYLLKLKERFTSYNFENVAKLKNKYSIRIYEVLKQCENMGHRDFKDFTDFKGIIGYDGKSSFRDIRRTIIEVAQKELEEHTDIKFEYEKITKGRKVVGLKFKIIPNRKNQNKLFDYTQMYSQEKLYNIRKECGLNDIDIADNLVIHLCNLASEIDCHGEPNQYIKLNVEHMKKQENIKNQYGYLKKALIKDYADAKRTIGLEKRFEEERKIAEEEMKKLQEQIKILEEQNKRKEG